MKNFFTLFNKSKKHGSKSVQSHKEPKDDMNVFTTNNQYNSNYINQNHGLSTQRQM